MNDSKLEILIKPLIKIYEDLELELIKDIAIRLNTYTGIEGSLKWYLDKLQEIGGFNKDNLALLAEYAGKSQGEVKEILRYAGYDVSRLDKYKDYVDDELLLNNPTQLYESVAVQNIINNSIKETNSIMETIQTKALESAKESYMKILTEAHMEVSGGIYSYDQAIKKALKKMAEEGFSGATYKNGKRLSLESTVRRDILTKVHQLAGDIQIEKAKQLGTNLVYVTQHLGARIRTKYTKEDYEVHYEWQGKVYMLDGSSDNYDNFYEKTGYGKLLGLCGVNCRHNFFPTFEGRSHPKLYDEEENEKEYIKQQKQRGYERQYRSLKYQKEVAKILDDKEQLKKLNPQIRDFNKEYNQFLEENNLQRDYSREYIEKDLIKIENERLSAGATNYQLFAKNKESNTRYVEHVDINDRKLIDSKLQEYSNMIKDEPIEHGFILDKNGDVFEIVGNERGFVPPKWFNLTDSIGIHNHPESVTNLSFSSLDIDMFIRGKMKEFHGFDKTYKYVMINNKDIFLADNFEIKRQWNKFNTELSELNYENKLDEDIDVVRYDYIAKQLAKEYGFTYRRIKK